MQAQPTRATRKAGTARRSRPHIATRGWRVHHPPPSPVTHTHRSGDFNDGNGGAAVSCETTTVVVVTVTVDMPRKRARRERHHSSTPSSAAASPPPPRAHVPLDIWIIIASKLSLADRTSMMRACKEFEGAVFAHAQSRVAESQRATRPGCVFVDDDPAVPCADTAAVGAFVRVVLARMRTERVGTREEEKIRLVAFFVSAWYDSIAASTHARAIRAAALLRECTRSWDARARGRCVGVYLREDIDTIGDRVDARTRSRAETSAWFAMHALAAADGRDAFDFGALAHLRRGERGEAWVRFSEGFSGVLSTREATHPGLFAVLCGPCAVTFWRRALATEIGEPRYALEEFDALFSFDSGDACANDAQEVEMYRVFSHGGMALTELEGLRRIGLEYMALGDDADAAQTPWDCFNFEIGALAKMLDFTYDDSSLTKEEFAWLVYDCSHKWSAGFVLALLATLADTRETFAYLISHFLFRDVWRLSTFHDASASDADQIGESIQRGHDILRMLARKGDMELQTKTCERVICELGRCLALEEREAVSVAINAYCGIADYMTHSSTYGISRANKNIAWFCAQGIKNPRDFFATEESRRLPDEFPMDRLRRSSTDKQRLTHAWSRQIAARVSSEKKITAEGAHEE